MLVVTFVLREVPFALAKPRKIEPQHGKTAVFDPRAHVLRCFE